MNNTDMNQTKGKVGEKQGQHTPGKWTLNGHRITIDESGDPLLVSHGFGLTPMNHPRRDEAEANARLIVAAPGLLESCQWFMAQLESGELVRDTSRDVEPDWLTRMMQFSSGVIKAQVAINRAAGRAE